MNIDETTPVEVQGEQLPWYLRVVLIFFGLLLISLLVTAAFLSPESRGYGTHRQLGLPPCSFKVLTNGKPCPSCGMTTSWSHLMHGQLIQSARANVGGTLLAIGSLFVAPWLVGSGMLGRWWLGVPNPRFSIAISLVVFGVIMVNWFIRLRS